MSPETENITPQEAIFATLWGASGIMFMVSLLSSVAIYALTVKELCPTDPVSVCTEDFARCRGEATCYCPPPVYYEADDPIYEDWESCRYVHNHLPPLAEISFVTTRTLAYLSFIVVFILFVYGRFIQFNYDV